MENREDVLDLQDAARAVDAVRRIACEMYGFQPHAVEPIEAR